MMEKYTSRTAKDFGSVTQLGAQKTKYPQDYDPTVLETFDNKHPENDYLVSFDAYEFTSLCPKTGQPDFAKVFISYIPTQKMVESKSLKLYLFGFRNHGDFHEDCMNIILNDLYQLMDPKYIEVFGLFTPRGGISIYPFVNRVNPKYQTAEIKQLAFQRKLQFLSELPAYKNAVR
jgi:7-cyano-7-deazaguanine reductase